MKTSVLLSAWLLGACATGNVGLDREISPRASVKLDLVPHRDATRTFPAVVDARLPSADRLSNQVLTELGDTASLEVRLCVAAAGSVASIEVTRSSKFPAFDQAVIVDAQSWQFASLPGPGNLKTCERATVTYRPRA